MDLPKRKPNRLSYYDYSTPGAYFVTICTYKRKNTLSSIVGDGFPVPKQPGQVAQEYIHLISNKYPAVIVDHYVIMPNHIHLLLRIVDFTGAESPRPSLGNVIGWYKYQVTSSVNSLCGTSGARFFQRSYHDHVIRNDQDYNKIWQYIETNPTRWIQDCFYTP